MNALNPGLLDFDRVETCKNLFRELLHFASPGSGHFPKVVAVVLGFSEHGDLVIVQSTDQEIDPVQDFKKELLFIEPERFGRESGTARPIVLHMVFLNFNADPVRCGKIEPEFRNPIPTTVSDISLSRIRTPENEHPEIGLLILAKEDTQALITNLHPDTRPLIETGPRGEVVKTVQDLVGTHDPENSSQQGGLRRLKSVKP
jgi:hypothetical protein